MSENKPEILILTTSYPRFKNDEASVFVKKFTDALSDENVSGSVVVPYDKDEKIYEEIKNFKIFRFKYGLFSKGRLAFGEGIMPNIRRDFGLIFQIPLMLIQFVLVGIKLRKNWQIVHAQWIASGIPAAFLSFLFNRKMILTIRGEDVKLLRSKLRVFFLPVLYRANKVTTVSDDFKDELHVYFPKLKDKIVTIPNGISRINPNLSEKEQLIKQFNLHADSTLLTFVGRIIPLKQPEILIKLLAKLNDTRFCLIFAGRISQDYKESLLNLAKTLNAQNQTIFLDAISPSDSVALISISKFYLSASSHEGRSNSLLESLAAGIPPVVSNIKGHAELVKDNINGLLFDPNDLNRAAERLNELYNNQESYLVFSKAAKESVKDLTWEKCARDFCSIYGFAAL